MLTRSYCSESTAFLVICSLTLSVAGCLSEPTPIELDLHAGYATDLDGDGKDDLLLLNHADGSVLLHMGHDVLSIDSFDHFPLPDVTPLAVTAGRFGGEDAVDVIVYGLHDSGVGALVALPDVRPTMQPEFLPDPLLYLQSTNLTPPSTSGSAFIHTVSLYDNGLTSLLFGHSTAVFEVDVNGLTDDFRSLGECR